MSCVYEKLLCHIKGKRMNYDFHLDMQLSSPPRRSAAQHSQKEGSCRTKEAKGKKWE